MYHYTNNGVYSISRVDTRDLDMEDSRVSFHISQESANKLHSLQTGAIASLSNDEKRVIEEEIEAMYWRAVEDYQSMSQYYFCEWDVHLTHRKAIEATI